MSASPFCRDCGRRVEWHPTTSNRKMPIDPDPHPDGGYYFDGAMKLVRGRPGYRGRMFRCHWDTCPQKAKAEKRRAEWKCDRAGCSLTSFHRHCLRCGATDHLVAACPDEEQLDENGDPTW